MYPTWDTSELVSLFKVMKVSQLAVPKGGPARNGRRLQPEGHPAHADKHGGGDVVVHHKLADVPGQGDSDVEGAEVAHHLPLRHPAHPEGGENDQRKKNLLGRWRVHLVRC